MKNIPLNLFYYLLLCQPKLCFSITIIPEFGFFIFYFVLQIKKALAHTFFIQMQIFMQMNQDVSWLFLSLILPNNISSTFPSCSPPVLGCKTPEMSLEAWKFHRAYFLLPHSVLSRSKLNLVNYIQTLSWVSILETLQKFPLPSIS